MLNDLEAMICFAAICEAGSITAAAKVLKRSKAHVSKRLSALEEALGLKLFHRTTRRMHLTAAGEDFQADAIQLLRHARGVHAKARGLDRQLRGPFCLTAPGSIAHMVLGPIFPEMRKQFPEIQFELRVTNQTLDLIAEGVDLGLRCGEIAHDMLIARPLGVSAEILCASKGYLQQQGRVTCVEDLCHHTLLANPYSFRQETLVLGNQDRLFEVEAGKLQRVDHFSLLAQWVSQQQGIGLLPEYCMGFLQQTSDVEMVLPGWQGKKLHWFMVYPYQSPIPFKTKAIVSFLTERLKRIFRQKP